MFARRPRRQLRVQPRGVLCRPTMMIARLLSCSALLLATAHPSHEDGDPSMQLYWDRVDPRETLGEHQHTHGVSGDDEDGMANAVDSITTVHVVQSCHLDIGFTSRAVDVINLYFEVHIPTAIAVGRALRTNQTSWGSSSGAFTKGHDRPGWPRNAMVAEAKSACSADDNCVGFTYRNTSSSTGLKHIYLKSEGVSVAPDANWTHWTKPLGLAKPGWRLRFTMQIWYISMYLDCPTGFGLRCPSERDKKALRDAIAVGDITYHAFPHNAELEAGSAAVIQAGLQMTHALDAEFGAAPKAVLSQRDVPGLTRAMIPLLKRHGVRAVSVGVNGESMYPRVPRIFRWRDPISSEEVVAMWHARGYGGWGKAEAVVVPGFTHALVTDWNSDNRGVRSAREYLGHLKAIQREWPNAQVVVSTFDNFTEQLLLSGSVNRLPVVAQEISDTWIYGDPSDARKSAQMRLLHRAWDAYAVSGQARDGRFLNATRFMLKNIE